MQSQQSSAPQSPQRAYIQQASIPQASIQQAYTQASIPQASIPQAFEYVFNQIQKIIEGGICVPEDFISFDDVCGLIRIFDMIATATNKAKLVAAFKDFTKHKWMNLDRREHVYALYQLMPIAVNYLQYFSECDKIWNHLRALKQYARDPIAYMQAVHFYDNYDYKGCEQARIEAGFADVREEKNANWDLFLLNPHDPKFAKFLIYTPQYDFGEINTAAKCGVWPSNVICDVVHVEIGSTIIVPFDEAKRSLDTYMCGLLTQLESSGLNYCIAGGSISNVLNVRQKDVRAWSSDIDLFVYGSSQQERADSMQAHLRWFASLGMKCYFAVQGSVIGVALLGVNRRFQLISVDKSTPQQIVGRFDFGYCEWCYCRVNGEGVFLGSVLAFVSLRTQTTTVKRNMRLRPERMIKVLHRGYDIIKDNTISKEVMDVGAILENDSLVQEYIGKQYAFYYPHLIAGMTPRELDYHVFTELRKETRAQLITTEHEKAFDSVKIGANFEINYHACSYETFSIRDYKLLTTTQPQYTLRINNSCVYLMSPQLTVIEVLELSTGLGIFCKISAEDMKFAEFCRALETDLLPRMHKKPIATVRPRVPRKINPEITQLVSAADLAQIIYGDQDASDNPLTLTHRLVTDNAITMFEISFASVSAQPARGYSIMTTECGIPMNIMDIEVGVVIEIQFRITLIKTRSCSRVRLEPIRVIKIYK